jgi:hypothetical protein
MATKEDILEQLIEEYLLHAGYFVRHNVKFRPRRDHPDFIPNQDSNHSDIDVIGFHPKKNGVSRVMVISCKSWQSGFDVNAELQAIQQNRVVRGREAWRGFRELVVPKWTQAFFDAVKAASGQEKFTYVTAVTKLNGDRNAWEQNESFKAALRKNPIKLLELTEVVDFIAPKLGTTLAATEVGRMLQLFNAAGLSLTAQPPPKRRRAAV